MKTVTVTKQNSYGEQWQTRVTDKKFEEGGIEFAIKKIFGKKNTFIPNNELNRGTQSRIHGCIAHRPKGVGVLTVSLDIFVDID